MVATVRRCEFGEHGAARIQQPSGPEVTVRHPTKDLRPCARRTWSGTVKGDLPEVPESTDLDPSEASLTHRHKTGTAFGAGL